MNNLCLTFEELTESNMSFSYFSLEINRRGGQTTGFDVFKICKYFLCRSLTGEESQMRLFLLQSPQIRFAACACYRAINGTEHFIPALRESDAMFSFQELNK